MTDDDADWPGVRYFARPQPSVMVRPVIVPPVTVHTDTTPVEEDHPRVPWVTATGLVMLVVMVAGGLLLLTSCAPSEEPAPAVNTAPAGTADPPQVTTFPVTVNGRQVWCVWAESQYTYKGTGLSCDFTVKAPQ